MTLVRLVRRQLVGLALGLVIGAALFLAGALATLSIIDAGASHDSDGVVHLCVNKFTGQTRAVPPGQPPNCNANETQVDIASLIELESLEARLDLLEQQVPDCLSQEVDGTARFSGCNVQIVNGAGSTLNTNGTGNLIVGYNENPFGAIRTGSHNIVVGFGNDYLSFGGLVVGLENTISSAYATVTGGHQNAAIGNFSSVSGGSNNTASGSSTSVSGGNQNEATSSHASVSGGNGNTASQPAASVSGGQLNTADGPGASVSGGFSNTASGASASVSGGTSNAASGEQSSISGGFDNTASGANSSVGGGESNQASGNVSTVGGGVGLTAGGGEFLP